MQAGISAVEELKRLDKTQFHAPDCFFANEATLLDFICSFYGATYLSCSHPPPPRPLLSFDKQEQPISVDSVLIHEQTT